MRYHFDVDHRRITVERHKTVDGLLFRVDGEPFPVEICNSGDGSLLIMYRNRCQDARIYESAGQFHVELNGSPHQARITRGIAAAEPELDARESGRTEIQAPMPGKIVKVMVAPGLAVEAQQPLLVIEAMKMQNELCAPRKGTIVQVAVSEGQAVPAGALLIALE